MGQVAPRLRVKYPAGVVLLLLVMLFPAGARAQELRCPVTVSGAVSPHPAPLRFGIYPGGPAGSVSQTAAPLPEDPQRRLAALQQLAGAAPFVVHIYTGFSGDARKDAGTTQWLDGEIAGYTAAGLQVELVTRYEPQGSDASANIAGFTEHVRGLVRRYGGDPGFLALQVGNEANLSGAAAASDGAYPGALGALVRGVIAAKDEVARSGHHQVRIGFNWAYDLRASAAGDFFEALARSGGSAFADAVDWVGLDAYPGTWTPQLTVGPTLPGLAAEAMQTSLQTLRSCLMPMAGLGADVPIQIAENGFPTGPGRSAAMQADAMDAMVRAVDAVRGRYNVTDYRWFDLRDSVTGDGSFESQYGITRDDYTPKAAFWTFRDLVAELSVAHGGTTAGPAVPGSPSTTPVADVPAAGTSTPPGTTACQTSPVKVRLPRWQGRRVTATQVRSGRRVVGRAREGRTTIRVALGAGVRRLALRQIATGAAGRQTVRTMKRTVKVCAAAKRRVVIRRAGAWGAVTVRAASLRS
jgi:hypothetical protein